MAHQSVPSLTSHVHPLFQEILDAHFGHQLERIDRIVCQRLAQAELVTCCYDLCRERATVEEIDTGLEYCERHFSEVERG